MKIDKHSNYHTEIFNVKSSSDFMLCHMPVKLRCRCFEMNDKIRFFHTIIYSKNMMSIDITIKYAFMLSSKEALEPDILSVDVVDLIKKKRRLS
jgi:hypothetical protein